MYPDIVPRDYEDARTKSHVLTVWPLTAHSEGNRSCQLTTGLAMHAVAKCPSDGDQDWK